MIYKFTTTWFALSAAVPQAGVQFNRHLKFKPWVKAWVKDEVKDAFRKALDRATVKAWVKAWVKAVQMSIESPPWGLLSLAHVCNM